MKVVCAWCETTPKGKKVEGNETAQAVSHTICKKCAKKMEKEIKALEQLKREK